MESGCNAALDVGIVREPTEAEHVAQSLLAALRTHSPRSVFDDVIVDGAQAPHALIVKDHAAVDGADAAVLPNRKAAAELLVRARLAVFADDTRTTVSITNAGRYWALHGGYFAYLKEDPPSSAAGGGGRQRNPEMEALRAEYMKLRLGTFWWSFGLSVAGFVMSIISVAIALFYGDRLLR